MIMNIIQTLSVRQHERNLVIFFLPDPFGQDRTSYSGGHLGGLTNVDTVNNVMTMMTVCPFLSSAVSCRIDVYVTDLLHTRSLNPRSSSHRHRPVNEY